MTRIYLIRHAEAEGNLYRIAQGQHNSILTDRGWRQVRALERRFSDIHIDKVYSSDLYRTCATASAIYKPRGQTLERRTGLREICVGNWEHRTWGDIAREDPEQLGWFGTEMTKWHVDGAETPWQVQERMVAELRRIAAENDGKTVAVVSHSYAIRLLLGTLQGYTMEQMGQTPHGDNTAVSLLEGTADDLKVVYRDDNSHLQTPEYLAQEKVVKRAGLLDKGARFEPLRLPEQTEFLVRCVADAWEESGHPEEFRTERLLTDAARRHTLVAYLGEEPIGVVQTDGGWLSLLCVKQDFRNRSYGIQLVGQAVMQTRDIGGEYLRIALPAGGMARKFLTDYGFVPGEEQNGRIFLEKDIRFDPEYLGEE